MNGYPRPGQAQAQVHGGSMNSTSRLATPQLHGHQTSSIHSQSQPPPSPGAPSPNMSRAERFEDEKRRIIESCFSKLDQNGQLAESYITHIRIQEDAQYPSSPPPPESSTENRKPRLIIIAVRSTGRVRMHKARENNNGSFSIGKTWNMEEMSCIESFANPPSPPQSEKEANHRAWAGSTGFVVTISKPYYWQAGTSKEKDFFIASAVKIYRKYTKGQVPELKGFDEREKNQILGGGFPATTSPPVSQQIGPTGGRIPSGTQPPDPPQPPFAQRDQSRDGSRYRQSPGPPPSVSDQRPGSGPSSRRPSDSPARFAPPPALREPRPFASTEQMRVPSRDGRPDFRPGTSPAPSGLRSPSAVHRDGRPIGQPPPSPRRVDSPSLAPTSGNGTAPLPLRSQSPGRGFQTSGDGAYDQRKASDTAPVNGPDLFQSARQRYMNHQAEPEQTPIPPSQSQLPPIETTSHKHQAQNGAPKPPTEPVTATSESSAGLDLGDAATINALTSYWGPDPQAAAAPPQPPAEPQRLTTPERLRRQGQVEPRDSDSDLRPAPLKAATPEAAPQRSDSPKIDEPPEVKPLQVSNNKSETERSMPGAFTPALLQPSSASSLPGTPDEEKQEEEQFRPGLGPMFKKRAIANRFKKAANAANAFKPRPGGAAEKILKAKAERDGEPDGITGVVPRPQLRRQDEPPMTPVDATPTESLAVSTPERPKLESPKPEPPVVEVSSPQSPEQARIPPPDEVQRSVELFDGPSQLRPTLDQPIDEDERLEQRQVRSPQVRTRRRSAQQEKYLAALGIDRTLLEDKGLEFEMLLSDFGWKDNILQPKQLTALEADLRREQGRVEAGSWLSHTDAAREERVAQVEGLLDKAIAECDELEGLLTLYHVELSSLNEDIAFIEAQSQGLQVQSANQKLLQSELQSLVDTMALDRRVMEPLRYGNLSDASGLEEVENSLVRLYQALLTMDPTMRSRGQNRPKSSSGIGENDTSAMVALREKKLVYEREMHDFCQRLLQFLDSRFMTSMNSIKGRVLRQGGGAGLAKLQPEAFSEVRNSLWMYSPLLLFAKELNTPAWTTLMRMYQTRANPLYKDAFRENVQNWKRAARASTGDETEVLFTAQEKEDPAAGGLTSTARKLTVKRSMTLAKTLRGTTSDKHSASEHRQPGAMMRSQAFADALNEMAPLVSREQNFVVDLFHANSMETTDFIDAVQSAPPSARRGTNLLDRKPIEPDREMAQHVTGTVNKIFDFFLPEMKAMQDWAMSEDPIQGVGIMASLCRHYFYLQESSQDYLLQFIDELQDSLKVRFSKFVEDQIRAIEDTKVKIKKRKGVIQFMKIFPHFAAAVENVFAAVAGNDYDGPAACVMDIRTTIDSAYEKLNRAMFDSLKVIAKESPTAPGGNVAAHKQISGADDPEDKEMLNYHILLIENMNHYVEEVDDGGRAGVLAEWKGRALMERAEALEAYIGRVIRRPLGKLLDFLESAESILSSNPGNPASLSSRPTYSRKALRTVMAQYDSKEVRRGIDTLRKRIEKHFGDADEEQISRGLVNFVCKECERNYERVLERTEALVKDVYPPGQEGEKDVIIDFSKSEIQAGFRR
ncbi:hypothetical protein AC579_6240 [Pseudocercospora musae]|uniref:Exocyst complex component Sec3 PIP2-binding N-terminal domain-containing protein n=1 Tax=Pseudocercospora musae TaxID=113226 RepID=A0A139ILX3_9PEZI|nr:hypothetical protein AC579_6240 [Pseudocercospora musae]